MLITKYIIENFLQNNNVEYTYIKGTFELEEYIVSSFFEPIEGGFYFAQRDVEIPSGIINSLFIVENAFKGISSNSFFCIKNADPQFIYYKILSTLFTTVSTGTISTFSIIHPDAVLGLNVQIDAFCVIGRCKLGDNVVVGSHSKIYDDVEIGKDTVVESMACIGTQGVAWTWNLDQTEKVVQPQLGGVTIGKGCFIGANAIIVRGSLNERTTIGDESLIAPSTRLGHGTVIGNFVHLANNVVTGGNVRIGDYCFIGSSVTFRPRVKVHAKTVVGAGALVIKNTSEVGKTLVGVPAQEIETKLNLAGMPKPKL